MNDIRSAILNNSKEKWIKVARLLWHAHMELLLPDDDTSYKLIEKELELMISDGMIEISGNLANWRESEVRRIIF